MTHQMLGLAAVLALFALLMVRCQEGNDCFCYLYLDQDGKRTELMKESTVVLGSLCTDADHGVCTEWCTEQMSKFVDDLSGRPNGTSLDQFLCTLTGMDGVNGTLHTSVAVCDQEPIDVGPQYPNRLCCVKGQRIPC
ncbi:uncharacterized protein LOC135366286 [Ornithodoros turicata]|uniref:uncharacterized protein LOC135366286 n=1 Tax=Ornithodoros turicata TaxID=34597 RepID=UPI00313A4322